MSEAGDGRVLVLVVEDEPLVALDLETILAQAGFVVIGPAADPDKALRSMIEDTVQEMYREDERNRFLEVTYQNGDKEVMFFKDFASGAMIESIVRRGKKLALKRYIERSEKGLTADDLIAAVREEFKENEDLPNTTNPDDWAKIAGRRRERIVSIKLVSHDPAPKAMAVERVVATGQYL